MILSSAFVELPRIEALANTMLPVDEPPNPRPLSHESSFSI
jgi:hypothetical protein